MTHKTKGIVLRTIQYGETSVITSIYTELFGLQSYIVKGVRQTSKRKQPAALYFQPGAMLDMEVYQNNLKNLQFIKEYKWQYIYQKVLFDVIRTAVAFFMIELFQHTIKQPEANPELFYLLEGSLSQADKGSDAAVANLPLYFSLHLAAESGFGIQGNYSVENYVLDLQEGAYTSQTPSHSDFIEGNDAAISSRIQHINFYNDLEEIKLSRETRNRLLNAFLLYTSLHITEFKALKSLTILQEVLS